MISMKRLFSMLLAISVMASMVFSGFDLESIATLIHVTNHHHSHTNDHGHDHHKIENRNSDSHQHVVGFSVTHHLSDENGNEEEPHEHAINFIGAIVALVPEVMQPYLPSIQDSIYSSPYKLSKFSSPYLDGLFRPPKC